ncbi:membrane stabilizing protein MspA [Staphylococcus gallinarum]|uniref:membrane stabilizing protein MspA n=1 Tax=Staphylococcus gallinarum TaxID=1293 RepID=UPI001E625490|nr:membrane stabilizing protein MspA [Staphylococcus gallinarum]MCD8829856.1 membrane stabilizing protein MspA [Staphylococcus gallinarum]MDN6413785.1 membrane stabilizing protein MspA [Staphylococcus gallinarum]MEB6056005.1 membrane stabilizing protein MspA [Staphylococcus gallinarum]
MQLYLIFLPILYLIVSYISIFKMDTIITRILRIIMSLLLLFVVAITTLSFPAVNWWVFILLLLIVGNVEITAFKHLKQDKKAIQILNMISLGLIIIYVILTLVLY